MEIEKHIEVFRNIVDKYKLKEKAEEISNFIASGSEVYPEDFALKFGMSKDEAEIFLTFIKKGIKFKEKHIDKK